MVKLGSLLLAALVWLAADAAHGRPPPDNRDEPELADEPPAFNMLGFTAGAGALPEDGRAATTFALGVTVEHPVFRKTRVFGEYEWLWLSPRPSPRDVMVVRPERDGSGHRVHLGLRRELFAQGHGDVRTFVDAELAGGVALVHDDIAGTRVVPDVLVGLRLGYDIYTDRDDSPSRTFEFAFTFRALAVGDGVGGMAGLAMLWGN
jgi:hypothetical protein